MKKLIVVLFMIVLMCVNSAYSQECEYVHKGIKYYEKLIYSHDGSQDLCSYYNLAKEYLKKDKIQKALNIYQDIIDINNKEEQAYIERAIIYDLYYNPKLANQEWVILQKNIPDSIIANEGMSDIYKDILDYENALKYINKAIQLSKEKNNYLLYKRGQILQKQGKYEDAIKDYTKFIMSKDFDEKSSYYVYDDRSLCYKKLGMDDKAKEDMDKYESYFNNSKISQFEKIYNNLSVNRLKKYAGELY